MHCVKEGSFTKASQIMFISPNAVMAQIDLFEYRLGFTVFERSRRGLKLTSKGQILYEGCLKLKKDAETTLAACSEYNKDSFTIRIGTSPVLSGNYLLSLCKKNRNILSGFDFKLIPFSNREEEASYILTHFGEQIDLIAALYDEDFLELYNCQALLLEEVTLDLAIPDNHPLFQKTLIKPEDLKNYGITLPQKGICSIYDKTWDYLIKLLGHDKVRNGGFRNLEYYNRNYIQNQICIALKQWDSPHPLFAIKPFDLPFKGKFGILYSSQPSETVKKFINAIASNVASHNV